MNLHKLILTNNACYKAGRTITPKGIMVHSTGANNPWLKRYVGPDDGLLGKNQYNNHWNQDKPGGRQVCVHAFIGKLADGTIATYQTLPWNHRGWHGGSGSKGSVNDTHISFEICEGGLTDATYFNAVYKEATELCAYLCKEYKLDPMADGVTMMNKLIFGHAVVLKPLLVSLRGMSSDDTLESIQAIDKKLEENVAQRNVLVGLMTKKYLEPAVYNKSNNELLQEAERLRRQKESITRFLNNDFQNLSEVSALLQYAAKASMLKGFDGELFARFVERVLVYSRTEIGFELKCGITLKERLVI